MGRLSGKEGVLGSLLRLVLQISARQLANREPSAGFSGLTKSRAPKREHGIGLPRGFTQWCNSNCLQFSVSQTKCMGRHIQPKT